MSTEENELHVILGISGGAGQALARQLSDLNKPILGINRSGSYPSAIPSDIEIVAADILDPETTADLLVQRGATHIYNGVNVAYSKWIDLFPAIAKSFIKIVESTGAKGIVADNLYMYGEEHTDLLHESLPYRAQGHKGKTRGKVARLYDQAMARGISLVICRAPDFYGPGVIEGSFYGSRVFVTAMEGKKVNLLGRLDQPHQIIYVDDFARAMITLALDQGTDGQVWHAPSAPAITQAQFVNLIFELLGQDPKVGSTPNLIIKLLAPFVPLLRELKEMLYEFNQPYQVDSSKYKSVFGNEVTSHRQAIQETLSWFKQHQTKGIAIAG